MKRIVSMLLALVLVVGMFPMGVFAETEDTPDSSASQTQASTTEKTEAVTPAPTPTPTPENKTGTLSNNTAQNPPDKDKTPGTNNEQSNKDGDNSNVTQTPTKTGDAPQVNNTPGNTGDPLNQGPENKKLENNTPPYQKNGGTEIDGKKPDDQLKGNDPEGKQPEGKQPEDKQPEGENTNNGTGTGNPTDKGNNDLYTEGDGKSEDEEIEEEEDEEGSPKARTVAGGTDEGDGGTGGGEEDENEIDLSSLTGLTKTYDGKATMDIASAATSLLSGKNVTLTATLESADAGSRKIINVTVTKKDDTDETEYKVTGYNSLSVTINKATVNDSGNISTTITVYKNVPTTYSINVANRIGGSGLKADNGCFMSIQSYTLKEGSSLDNIFPSGTGSASLDDCMLNLNVKENFTGFNEGNSSVTYTIASKNYENFDYTLNFEAVDLTYTVTYDLNGGKGTAPASSTANSYTAEITLLSGEGLNRTNYEFTGWNTQADGKGTEYKAGATASKLTKTNNGTVKLYAQWKATEKNKPELTKEDVEGLLSANNVQATYIKYGDDTQKETYNLADMTGWTYAVSGNDADGYTLTITMTEAAWQSKESAAATKLGGTGETWKLYPTDDHPYNQKVVFNYSYTEGPAAEEGGNETVTFSWTLDTSHANPCIYMNQYFTVTYLMEDTDTTPPAMKGQFVKYSVVKDGAVPAFEENGTVTITNKDYKFLGWTSGSEDPSENPWVDQKVTGDITYTGKWRHKTMTIHFEKGADDATGTMADITMVSGSTGTLPACAFTRPGYRFTQWSYDAGGVGTLYAGDKASYEALPCQDGATLTLTALWQPVVSQVNFTLSGYGYGKKVTGVGVTTSTTGVSFTGGYNDGYDGFYIRGGEGPITSTEITFGADRAYYLVVNFGLENGYADGGLTKDTVYLNGKPAIELMLTEGSNSGSGTEGDGVEVLDDGASNDVGNAVYQAKFQLPTIREIKVYLMTKNGTVEVTGANYSGDAGVYYAMDGDEVTFKVTPAKGYVCYTLKLDGKSQKISTGKYTLTVRDSHVVKIWFAKDSGNAKTGDDIRLVYLAAAGIVSLAALTALAVIGLKKKKK